MKKRLLLLFFSVVLVFGVIAYGVFYLVEPKTYTASQDARIDVALSETTHPYIRLSASSTAAWIFVDAAQTAINAAQETVNQMGLDCTAEDLLSKISVKRLQKNIWITITVTDESPAAAREIISVFSRNLYEDVASATQETLPFASFTVLRPVEINNDFSWADVWLRTIASTFAFAVIFATVLYLIVKHAEKKKRSPLLRPKQEKPHFHYGTHLKQLFLRVPLRIACAFLAFTFAAYGVFQFFAKPRYIATQLACVFLMEDDIYTTEMVMDSQEFLQSYETYLVHPLLFRYFYHSLPASLTQIYTEQELFERYHVVLSSPAGVYRVTFTADTPEQANLLCSAFIHFSFNYLCDTFDLGEVKPVGFHPEVEKQGVVWDKIAAVGVGAFAAFGTLVITDLAIRRDHKKMQKLLLTQKKPPQE